METRKNTAGTLVAFEGIDGSGKTTHSNGLAEYFRLLGRKVTVSHEPTTGPWGSILRRSASEGRLSPQDELEYFLKDRQQHVDDLINPSLEAGEVVILDRYYFSTMAYQGSRGFDPTEIRKKNEAFAPVPDHLFILDIDVDTALARIGGRGDTANEFEQRDSLQKCRDIFLSLTDEPFVHVIDSSGSLDEVQQAIRKALA